METAMNSKTLGSVQANNSERWPRWKGILFFGGIAVLLVAWFGLGFYLHMQVVESRAKVEKNRIEAQRKDARARREAQYKQEVQQRTKAPQTRNVFDGRK